jgi:hypothetical protein
MTEIVQNKKNNDNRWQPKDHDVTFPFEEKANKKNVILIVVYLTLLIGSLFTI